MPTKNPRINLVVSPGLSAMLRRLSELTGRSQSDIIVRLLLDAVPALKRWIAALEAAEEAEDAAQVVAPQLAPALPSSVPPEPLSVPPQAEVTQVDTEASWFDRGEDRARAKLKARGLNEVDHYGEFHRLVHDELARTDDELHRIRALADLRGELGPYREAIKRADLLAFLIKHGEEVTERTYGKEVLAELRKDPPA